MGNRLAWGVVLMVAGLALMVGEYWFAVTTAGLSRLPAAHRILEWIIIAYGAYLAGTSRER
jgi:hypothetical protein